MSSRCQFCKSDPCVTPDFCKAFKKAHSEGKLDAAVAAFGASVQKLKKGQGTCRVYSPEEIEAGFTKEEAEAIRNSLAAIETLKKYAPKMPATSKRAVLTELSMRIRLMLGA